MIIGDQIADIARNDVVASAAKASIPISVVGVHLVGYTLADWVLIFTLIYTVLQTVFLIRDKLFRRRKSRKEE